MHLVSDLQIHSPYARAVSKFMLIPEMVKWAGWKGINLLGTGDCTHPEWLTHLKEHLEEDGTGLLQLKGDATSVRFMIQGEISLIYSQGGRGRRVHVLIFAPSFKAIEQYNEKIAKHGKLRSDGRPVLGLSAKQALQYLLNVNNELGLTDDIDSPDYVKRPGMFMIPAHVWTPWFGLFGSKSGFDSVEECFEELTPHIRAIETGLSSDLKMNWRLSANDSLALVSFSDAHSAPNMMREATVLEVKEPTYANVAQALQNPLLPSSFTPDRFAAAKPDRGSVRVGNDRSSTRSGRHLPAKDDSGRRNYIAHTLEFFPEEGKYHYDGIAAKNLSFPPAETKRLAITDPQLLRQVTVGVLHRVDDLADRPEGYQPTNRPNCRYVIPLQEIIADCLGVSKQSKKVQREYERLVMTHTEFDILLNLSQADLTNLTGPALAESIVKMRAGKVVIQPGYDGIFGTIKIA